jgi:DNA-binding protein YbaB
MNDTDIKQFDDNGLRELLLDDDVLTRHKNEAIDELILRAFKRGQQNVYENHPAFADK